MASQNADITPLPRAGHAMVSVGDRGLMCGGMESNVSHGGGDSIRVPTGILRCWWLMHSPHAIWTRLRPTDETLPSKPWPQSRSGHTLVYDAKQGGILVFAGSDDNGTMLSDCWWLSASFPHVWSQCGTEGIIPSPRVGHGAVYLRGAMYILGGFASDGLLGTVTLGDLWSLTQYSAGGSWTEIMPASASPTARAYFGCWTSGFHIMVHGGQGPGGQGPASVLQDTWQFNTFTGEWYLFRTSDTVPVASHLSIASPDSSTAVSFGGKSKDGLAMGKLFTFDRVSGWSQGDN
jgi:hypothetical protein